MPTQEVVQLHPSGWESDPEEERFKVSTIDRTPTCAYNQYMVFFRVDDAAKSKAVAVLRQGLEKTISQARYMCATIEKDPEGGHSFVKKKGTTVKLVIKKLDSPDEKHPSLDDIEKAYFSAHALGDLDLWSIPTMTWGERPEADPDRSPIVAAYQINLARGGIIFSMHSHHYASDVMGWHNFTHQLAVNCEAIANGKPFPEWNPLRTDVSRFTKDLPEESLIDGPPTPQRHPDHPEQQSVLFHLPRSKAEHLKRLATPPEPRRISTYDAMCAYIWRVLSKVRAPLYNRRPSEQLRWAEAVNMRGRLHNPPLPDRMMRNIVAGAFSHAAPVKFLDNPSITESSDGPAPPTIAQVISEAPLFELSSYIRQLTNSCTEEHLEVLLDMIAPIRDKRSISLRVDSYEPMSIFVTDHRSGDVGDFDFGFGKPITYRHLWGSLITAGLILVYAPIRSAADPDEGCMFTITMEKELVPKLLEEPDWTDYFEYRGLD